MSEEVAIKYGKEIDYKYLAEYKAQPVRRVYIPNPQVGNGDNGKMRPLGIPIIKDRIIQELFRLILDPMIEIFSDPNSYGFRKGRNCHQAIGVIGQSLRTTSSIINRKVKILDFDIKDFFNSISKE